MQETLKKLRIHLKKAIQNAKNTYAKSAPRAKKLWNAYGYYVSLGALLLLFGIAAYSYKNNKNEPTLSALKPENSPAAMTVSSVYAPAPTPEPEPELAFIMPVSGEIVTEYSPDKLVWNETLAQWETHSAVDISAQTGAAVSASEAGVISAAYKDALLGYVVEITHKDGYVTLYGSLGTLELAEVGKKVAKGDIIGSVGLTSSAEAELGAHLHYKMTHDGADVEPIWE